MANLTDNAELLDKVLQNIDPEVFQVITENRKAGTHPGTIFQFIMALADEKLEGISDNPADTLKLAQTIWEKTAP